MLWSALNGYNRSGQELVGGAAPGKICLDAEAQPRAIDARLLRRPNSSGFSDFVCDANGAQGTQVRHCGKLRTAPVHMGKARTAPKLLGTFL